MNTETALTHEQVDLCFSISSKSRLVLKQYNFTDVVVGQRLVLMALNQDDFTLWADGLRLLLGQDVTCLQTVTERRRLKRQFFTEYGWAQFATS